jgi:ATP-binding cassette subfamily B protein IrtA
MSYREAVPAPLTMTSGIASLLPFARPVRGRLALAGLLALASTLAGLVPLWVVARAAARLIEDTATMPEELTGLAAVALAAVVARYTLLGLSTWVAHVAAYDLLYGLRVQLAERLAVLPLGYLTRRRSGEVKKVMADDVERLEVFLAHGVPDLVAAAGSFVALAVWMAMVDWRLGLATFALAPVALAAIAVALRRSAPNMGAYHEALGRMNATVAELVQGIGVVRTFCPPGSPIRPVSAAVDDYVRIVQRYSRDFLPFGTIYYVLLGSAAVTVVPTGLGLWRAGALDTATLVLFLVVGIGALHPLRELLKLFSQLAHLSTGGNLVRDVLTVAPPRTGDRTVILDNHTVELDGVTFRYEPGAAPALDGVSITAQPGTVTALVGPSGSGKTTAARLVPRFFDPDEGEVRLGGVPLAELPEAQLQAAVAFVFQDTFLFDDTVAANLRAGRPGASGAEVEAAARLARAHEFITALPQGYDTRLGERGARLSGGERQRLAIARAILKDAPVIVLDEATAFADPDNETALQEAITSLVTGTGPSGRGSGRTDRTVIMIAHRLSTIAGADQIVVLEHGRVVERGRHDALVTARGPYARLWEDFMTAESLALGRDVPA